MMRTMIACVALLVSLTGASGEMTAGEFLDRAEKIENGGLVSAQSTEVQELRAEARRVGALYRAELDRRAARGEPQHSCPPPRGAASLSGKDLRAYLKSLGAAELAKPYRLAFFNMMKDRFPCPKS